MTTTRPRLLNVADYQAAASTIVDPVYYDFFAGAARDEITMRANESAFQQLCLLPRILRGSDNRRHSVELFGSTASMPVLLSPTAFHKPIVAVAEAGAARMLDEQPMTLAELREAARRVLGVDLPFGPPKGPGPHALRRIDGQNTRLADRYRERNVFLVGDAAHVHSGVGGPGLNLGLQDAVNLAWKLAAHVNGWAPPNLLDSYQAERRPIGERVMMLSLAQSALMLPGPEITGLRELFGELVLLPEVATHIARLMVSTGCCQDSWLVRVRTSAATGAPNSAGLSASRMNGVVTAAGTCQDTTTCWEGSAPKARWRPNGRTSEPLTSLDFGLACAVPARKVPPRAAAAPPMAPARRRLRRE